MNYPKYAYKAIENKIKRFLIKNKEIAVIEIGDIYFKVIVYDNTRPKGISFSWSRELPELAVEQQGIINTDMLLNLVNELKEKLLKEDFDLEELCFVISVNGFAQQRLLEFPKLENKELQEAIAWEITQYINWPEGSYEYRYKLSEFPYNKSDESLTSSLAVTVYALPKELIKSLLYVFSEAKLLLVSFTVTESIEDLDSNEQALKEIDFYEGFYNVEKLEKLRKEYYALIMAAIGFCNDKLIINFLPKSKQQEAMYFWFKKLFKYSSIVSFSLSFILLVSMQALIHYKYQEVESINGKLQKLAVWQTRLRKVQNLEQQIHELEIKIKYLEKQKVKWNQQLKYISHCLPDGCWLTNLEQEANTEHQGRGLILQGKAENLTKVNQFLNNLKASELYEKVELINSDMPINTYASINSVVKYKLKIKFKKL
ncbi:MAG: PilN domain-containing protein [Phascolarctobacterium sp.]|nr:PilN domain-containing protein [Phascolarctobacterium sp.]